VPAAAVIPAPIAYIKVVAVKKLVVGFLDVRPVRPWGCTGSVGIFLENVSALKLWLCGKQDFYLEKIRVFKQAYALNTLAWNNK
jgi:hypothetical protein